MGNASELKEKTIERVYQEMENKFPGLCGIK
jgi:hypothetical protein